MPLRKSSDRKIDRLARTDLFRDCPPEALRAVQGLVDEVSRPAGTVLATQGWLPRQLLLIIDGSASAYHHRERVASQVREVGLDALTAGTPHADTVVADTLVRLLVVHPRDRDALLTAVPGLARRLERSATPMPSRARVRLPAPA